MSRSVGLRFWILASFAIGVVMAAVLSEAAAGLTGSERSSQPDSKAVAAARPGAEGAIGGDPANPAASGITGRLPVAYGLAEPAGALPGTDSVSDVEAWSHIRDDIAGSGSCWLRSDLDHWLTRAIEAFPWLGSGSTCSAAGGAPVKVLAILDQQTIWAAPRLCPDVPFSATYERRHNDFTIDDWRQLVGCIVHQFTGRISAYEIWNEPLLPNSIQGYEDGSAAHYADLLRVASMEIKAADPEATVIALGGSDIYAGGDQARLDQMRAFTTELVALGSPRYADAISLHAYPWGHDDAALWASYQQELRFQAQAWQRPVWITETGTRATDPGTQSGYAEKAYSILVGAGVDHLFWFSITDQPDGAFGLRGRPVESTLRSFVLDHS
jgi:hypothetical protein